MPRDGSVHMLNLVEGEEARITSPTGSFQPFTVHYAQTFILPEGAGGYRVGSPPGRAHPRDSGPGAGMNHPSAGRAAIWD